MDLIHKLSIGALVVLTLVTAGMLFQHQVSIQHQDGASGGKKLQLKKSYEERMARDGEIYGEVVPLLKQKNFSSAKEKLEKIQAVHPDNPMTSVYLAQLQYGQGQLAEAIHSYRIAVDSEPDFVDKKTPLFIGNTIMELITEARGKLKREQKLKPDDKSIGLAMEDLYYLQRRIAGGCE